uniref:DUF6452 family protein n=1 Tax=Gelidibacter sp. TaxID=2018083 RepID=UPI004048F1EF
MTFKNSFLSVFTLIALCFLSCERDDICASTTGTTPNLIIRFYDINNPETLKSVRQLSIFGEGNEDELILGRTNTDSINLPLKFDDEGILTNTRFILKKDTDFDDIEDDNNFSNSDIIQITYTPEFIYVSRACGYKSVFNEAQISYDNDGDNWIINTEVLNPTVENENAAHIIIYH